MTEPSRLIDHPSQKTCTRARALPLAIALAMASLRQSKIRTLQVRRLIRVLLQDRLVSQTASNNYGSELAVQPANATSNIAESTYMWKNMCTGMSCCLAYLMHLRFAQAFSGTTVGFCSSKKSALAFSGCMLDRCHRICTHTLWKQHQST